MKDRFIGDKMRGEAKPDRFSRGILRIQECYTLGNSYLQETIQNILHQKPLPLSSYLQMAN